LTKKNFELAKFYGVDWGVHLSGMMVLVLSCVSLLAVQGIAVFTGRTMPGNIQCIWDGARHQVCGLVLNQPVPGYRQLWWKGLLFTYA